MTITVDIDADIYALNNLMEFDHVIEVHEDGTVSERSDIYAPECFGDEMILGWTLLRGYSGQWKYSGPVMHDSEFIGGGMARDILSTPGVYVAVIVYDLNAKDDEDNIAGWAVARKND